MYRRCIYPRHAVHGAVSQVKPVSAQTKTIRRRPPGDTSVFSDNIHPVLKRVLAARHATSDAELDYQCKHLLSYEQLSGIEAALDLLTEALQQQQRILIVADFDADGATSCALGIRALRLMGAKNAFYLVPNRFEHGYGLTPQIADIAAEHFQAQLLITVDNGISSLEGVARAKKHGMKVLVTDHHLPGETLPQADAIVNPNRHGDAFPSKNLAGVGVIFYVMAALRAHLRQTGWFEQHHIAVPNLAALLDLAALGTVADLVPLDYNNRILVNQGLERIRHNQCCPGIRALVEVSGRKREFLSASDLSFYLGPRLNAAGRMEDMGHGIECLLADTDKDAMEHAQMLDMFNQERRAVEDQMKIEANEALRRMSLNDGDDLPFGLCLFDPEWHQGVIGILASRVKERLHRPVIVLTRDDAQQGHIKGSARSVKGVHIRDVLADIEAQQPGIFTKFGGHAMAAGLTMPAEHLDDFRAAFDREVRRHLHVEDMQGVIHTDGELGQGDFTVDFANILRTISPWGQSFPEPLFDGKFELLQYRVLKGRHLKMALQVPGSNETLDAIAFNATDSDWPEHVTHVNLAYRLELNFYRGFQNIQINAQHVEAEPVRTG